jgi:hypothetical protein
MSNRIRQIRVHNSSLSPTHAEVCLTVFAERQTPTTEVRGRLTGPSCLYASTVEIAYPLRVPPSDGQPATTELGITRRVIIPEPSLWDTESPFLYQGVVELWQDGQRCDKQTIRHGLRSLQRGKRGLLLNGRPLRLRGRSLSAPLETALAEDAALRLREADVNLLLAPVEEKTLRLWPRADRFGFLVLGRVRDESERTLRHLETLSNQASCLGWLMETNRPVPTPLPPGGLLGWTGDFVSPATSLAGIDFLFGSLELANLGKPMLVKGEVTSSSSEGCSILGTVA